MVVHGDSGCDGKKFFPAAGYGRIYNIHIRYKGSSLQEKREVLKVDHEQ